MKELLKLISEFETKAKELGVLHDKINDLSKELDVGGNVMSLVERIGMYVANSQATPDDWEDSGGEDEDWWESSEE